MKRILPCILALLTLFPACSNEDPPVTPDPCGASGFGILVLNEGNFQRANASLSFVTSCTTVIPDIFKRENGRDLGDTGNSLTLYDFRVYIVMNGSNRIEVIDWATKKWIKTIALPPGSSPRHIVFDNRGRGFISCLYTNEVVVYDDSADAIIARIPVGANPEQMLVSAGKLFVTNSGLGAGSTVSVIDLSSPSFPVNTTLRVGDNPTAILPAPSLTLGQAVVLCTGAWNDFQDPNDDTPGSLYTIDIEHNMVIDSLTLGGHPQRLALARDGVYYTVREDGIMRIEWPTKTWLTSWLTWWLPIRHPCAVPPREGPVSHLNS